MTAIALPGALRVRRLIATLCIAISIGCHADVHGDGLPEQNKRLARGFLEDLWLSNNTDRYDQYVAESYVVHDIGERKNVQEAAIEQKQIADFFWENGTMTGDIDYQIAQGDLVATRWRARFEPSTLIGRFMIGRGEIPIINVFRFRDGKIVEVWNHRHDIDTPQTMKFALQGFVLGLLFALPPLIWAWRLRRHLRH